jgi:hypothetical protein
LYPFAANKVVAEMADDVALVRPELAVGEPAVPRWRGRRITLPLVALLMLVSAGAGGVVGHLADFGGDTRPNLEKTEASFPLDPKNAIVKATETSMTIEFPEEYGADDEDMLAGLLESLGFSDGILARMAQTRALDGTQHADGDGVSASWNFHPDDGLSIVLEVD